jgi:ribosome biogenesis protein ERB1
MSLSNKKRTRDSDDSKLKKKVASSSYSGALLLSSSSSSSDDDSYVPEEHAWQEDDDFREANSDESLSSSDNDNEEEEEENERKEFEQTFGSEKENKSDDDVDSSSSDDENENGKEKTNLSLVLGADSDDSEYEDDEEEVLSRNTIGNVPLAWYDGLDHIGYNLRGEKILRPKTKDEIEKFLDREESPSTYWRTVFDEKNQREVVLSKKDMAMLLRAAEGRLADASDPYANPIPWPPPTVVREFPLLNTPEPKRRFVPSKFEMRRVRYLMRAIRAGHIKVDDDEDAKKKRRKEQEALYMLWTNDDDPRHSSRGRRARHMPAPKMRLPGHAESYRPPAEFLPDEQERAKIEASFADDPDAAARRFVPQSFDALRRVPLYENLIRERFDRCLDLYLCPRAVRMRRHINKPEDLLPELPKPAELRPFPTRAAVRYLGHEGHVLSVSVSTDGQWVATGGADRTMRVFELATGRCMRIWRFADDDAVRCVQWHPMRAVPFLAVATGKRLLLVDCSFLYPVSFDRSVVERLFPSGVTLNTAYASNADIYGESDSDDDDAKDDDNNDDEKEERAVDKQTNKFRLRVAWTKPSDKDSKRGVRICVDHISAVAKITWHSRGDYFATSGSVGKHSVHIHRLSRAQSQNPFRRAKVTPIEAIAFHPSKPIFFVGTQRHVRVYNLLEQRLAKRLLPGVKWLSSMAVHPASGDHVLVGSYDKRVCWFDLDLSRTPYRKLRYHASAVRSVVYHGHLPLFATASDDLKIHVFHARVYDDLLKNPLIVPVKILSGHSAVDKVGVLDLCFHPQQPFLVSAGADGKAILYV